MPSIQRSKHSRRSLRQQARTAPGVVFSKWPRVCPRRVVSSKSVVTLLATRQANRLKPCQLKAATGDGMDGVVSGLSTDGVVGASAAPKGFDLLEKLLNV